MSTQRRKLIAGNWKMHLTAATGVALVRGIQDRARVGPRTDVVVAPPFTLLHAVGEALRGSAVQLAGQNCHWEEQGAHTGEIAPAMLRDVGCVFCLVGHSERRQNMAETDEQVARKTLALLKAELRPIVCVGETLSERERGLTFEVVRRQLEAVTSQLDDAGIRQLVVAYEPVWAIGTGKTAKAGDAQAVHAYLRDRIRHQVGELADGVRLLYGGSVKADNAAELLAQPDIDGALVGGASLDIEAFSKIILAAG